MAGITIPADTTSIPSFIIALRESFIMVFPLCLIQMIFGRCHHQVQRATYTVDWIALAIAKRYLLDYFATIAHIEVIDEQCTSVRGELTVEQERSEVIDKVLRRVDMVCINGTLQIGRCRCTILCGASSHQ